MIHRVLEGPAGKESDAGREVALSSLTGADMPLVAGWLAADHVRRFWGDPEKNLQAIREAGTDTGRAVISFRGRRVGLVCWRHPSREELDEAGLTDIATSVVDLDIMIGELAATGRGVGPAVIRLLAGEVLADPRASGLIAAICKDNTASFKAFCKAGFHLDREFDDSVGGPCLLMAKAGPGGGFQPSGTE